jgi:hypothetical protein
MQAVDAGLFHLGCNRMTAVARQPIDAGADKEVSAKLLRQAIQFVDVAFAVATMNATRRLSSRSIDCLRLSSHRTLSFFSIGTRVGLIFFLSCAAPLNFFRVQNFTAAKPSGRPRQLRRDWNASAFRRPCDDANPAAIDALGQADGARIRTLVGEFRRVLNEGPQSS